MARRSKDCVYLNRTFGRHHDHRHPDRAAAAGRAIGAEAARRLQCQNNLKQLSLACANHESTFRFFPSGGWGFSWAGDPDRGFGKNQPGGWTYSILPFIEQGALHDLGANGQPDQWPPSAAKTQGAVTRDTTPLVAFTCPSRRNAILYPRPAGYYSCNSAPHGPEGPLDYSGNSGSRSAYAQCGGPSNITGAASYNWSPCGADSDDGVIYSRSETKIADITDGTSNTFLLGEKYLMSDHYYDGTEATDDGTPFQGHGADVDKHASANRPPLQDRAGYAYYYAFGSAHDSGVCMSLCDGSVRWINYSIDTTTYSRLGSRNDGQPIDGSKF